MTAKHGMLQQIEGCIEQFAGKPVAQKVMEGSEQITEKTDKKKTAQWLKQAMERLDATVNEKTRARIMQSCGYNCAEKNSRVIERAMARRRKFGSVEEFLVAEIQKPMKGTRLQREGDILYQFYTPQAFTRPMRVLLWLVQGAASRGNRIYHVLQLCEGVRGEVLGSRPRKICGSGHPTVGDFWSQRMQIRHTLIEISPQLHKNINLPTNLKPNVPSRQHYNSNTPFI